LRSARLPQALFLEDAMQITINNDFITGGPFTQAQIDSFLQDEQIAVNILDATFTNNISLTFNVGFASMEGQKMAPTDGGLGNANFDAAVLLPYSQLRTDLLTSGQPGFFNAANLPAGDSINGMSNFWISPSTATALGLAAPNRPPDGFVGINTTIAPGNTRVATILHEIGHAVGRLQANLVSDQGVVSVSALDLVRFISPGNRLFDGAPNAPTPAYFSVDGGAKKVADWSAPRSPADFLSPPNSNLSPNDPFNDVVDSGGMELRKFTTADIQLMVALGFRVGATAVMVLQGSNGFYQSYSIGSNAVSGSAQLGPVGSDWRFVTLGSFNDSITSSFTSDMLLRNSTSGNFQVYNISNNAITNSVSLGAVGLNWQFSGVGNFSVPGESDMLLRDSTNGDFQVYNISNNAIVNSVSLGEVGLNWQFSGVGNFGGMPGRSDMILRNTDTGELFVYNIRDNQITNSVSMGTVGLEWQFSGVGDFSSNPGESDMILRNANSGELLVYNINNNQITGSASLGTVGLDWQFAGVAPIRVPGAADLVLRNVTTGQFQLYNIADNQITGTSALAAVGLDWQLGGFAPTASNGFTGNSGNPLASGPQPSAGATSQLVQAMAGFGGAAGGVTDGTTSALGADAPQQQQQFLTTPHA
jgi:hypothetical protein